MQRRPARERQYSTCLRTQLLSLRTDFGKDLGRLSVSDRKTVDTACNEVRTASGRDAYLDCVGNQLTGLPQQAGPHRSRRHPCCPRRT